MKKLVSILLVVMLLGSQIVFAEEKLENVVDLSLEDIKSIYVAKYSGSINDVGVEITGENVKVFLNKFMQNNIVEFDDSSVSVAITFYTRDYKKPNIMYNSKQGFYRYDEVLSEKIISSDKVIEIVEELGYEWKVNNAGASPTGLGGASFNIDCSDWSADYIVQAKDLGFLEGITDLSYKEPITREKFCEIVYNMISKATDKKWSVPTAIPFVDTYNSKVATLYYEDIVKGKGDKIFAPNDYLTREEAATIIDRIYKNGVPLGTGTTGVWLKFDDESEISDWALYSVQNACKQGIMIGTGSGKFAPKDIYTTEQAITSIVRMYHQNFKGINQE